MPPINNVWASNAPLSDEQELTLPSGQTCRARRIGMEGMVQAGLISENDTLSSLVDEKHIRKVRGSKKRADGIEIDTQSLIRDPNALADLVKMTEQVMPMIVVSPTVMLHRLPDGSVIPIEDRNPDAVYTDQISMIDKFELFTWSVGDTEALNNFRGNETGGSVAAVGARKSVSRPAKRAARGK